MRHALFPVGRTSGMPVLILDLNTDDGTSVLMHIAIRLLGNLGKKDVHILQILRIIRSKRQFAPLFFSTSQSGKPPFLHSPCAHGPIRSHTFIPAS